MRGDIYTSVASAVIGTTLSAQVLPIISYAREVHQGALNHDFAISISLSKPFLPPLSNLYRQIHLNKYFYTHIVNIDEVDQQRELRCVARLVFHFFFDAIIYNTIFIWCMAYGICGSALILKRMWNEYIIYLTTLWYKK